MRISIFGLGYIGAISLACLARIGHHVIGLDVDPQKTAQVQRGEPPIREPGLFALFKKRDAALAQADAVLMGRPLSPEFYAAARLSGAALIDLVGTLAPVEAAERYHGLYW